MTTCHLKRFRRSFKYLLPYRGRLGASLVCVVFIAALWGGGMGMIGPVLKILIDEEGLKGLRGVIQNRALTQAGKDDDPGFIHLKVPGHLRFPPDGEADHIPRHEGLALGLRLTGRLGLGRTQSGHASQEAEDC